MDKFQLYDDGRELIEICERLIRNCRRVRFEAVHGSLENLTKRYGKYAEYIAALQADSKDYGIFPDANCLMQTISDVLAAEQAKDYIMLADFVELSLKPMLLQIQNGLRQIFGNLGNVYNESIEAANLMKLGVLARQLKNVKPYNLEETNVGYATVALTDSLGNYYFHSNVDPVWEARALIED
ncbi:MAG: hypothetical protein K5656_11525, partial [Lachnospiraceae bacterium]|nr:hypothetical protein [Lachnospiraceae bacterium]